MLIATYVICISKDLKNFINHCILFWKWAFLVTKPHTWQDTSRKLYFSRNRFNLPFYSVRSRHLQEKCRHTGTKQQNRSSSQLAHVKPDKKYLFLTNAVIRMGSDFSMANKRFCRVEFLYKSTSGTRVFGTLFFLLPRKMIKVSFLRELTSI